MSSIMRRRNGPMASSVIRVLLFEVIENSPTAPLAAAPYRASGLVPWPSQTFRKVRFCAVVGGKARRLGGPDSCVHGLVPSASEFRVRGGCDVLRTPEAGH